MKTAYEAPEMTITVFECMDIITASNDIPPAPGEDGTEQDVIGK